MRKAIVLTLTLCVCSTVAMAQSGQLQFLPMDDEVTWVYSGPRETPGSTTLIYSENTSSGFFSPYDDTIGIADDLPGWAGIFGPSTGPDNPEDWSITGFSFQYSLRASLSQLPVTATVRFLGLGPAFNFITAEYGRVTINSLTTGTVVQVVTLVDKIVAPKDIWMEVQFSSVFNLAATTRREGVGWGIAADIHSEGAPAMGNSADIIAITDNRPVGSDLILRGSFFGGYTPLLPTTDPNYTLPGNFIFDVFGKKVPEPMTMGLMAMGLTGFAALRRRR